MSFLLKTLQSFYLSLTVKCKSLHSTTRSSAIWPSSTSLYSSPTTLSLPCSTPAKLTPFFSQAQLVLPLPQSLCTTYSLCLKVSPLCVYMACLFLLFTLISIWRVLFTILNLIPHPSIPCLLPKSLFFSKEPSTFDTVSIILYPRLI